MAAYAIEIKQRFNRSLEVVKLLTAHLVRKSCQF